MNPLPQDSTDLHNWTDRIFQCLLSPSAPEEAATVAAATWLAVGHAEAATVTLFTSASSCITAVAHRDPQGHVDVAIKSQEQSIGSLFSVSSGADTSTDSTEIHPWPHRLSLCEVTPSSRSTTWPADDIAGRILENAATQQTVHPAASHLASMAEFAAGAGHEINNPLGSIIGQTQLLLKHEQQTDRRQALATIGSQAWRIRDMIGDCMLFARPPEPVLASANLTDVVHEAATAAANAAEQSPDCVQFELPTLPLASMIDATQIKTLVSHLVRNGVEAALSHSLAPRITVRLESQDSAVLLTVDDQGPGIEDETLRRHLFDPFFSGRQAGRGIGFGLPVCWQIARNHNGLILCETPVGGGSRFVVAWPKSQ